MGARVRPALLLCAGLAATACYQPEPVEGLPCSAVSRACPDGQECGADNVCRRTGASGPDIEPCSATVCEVEVLAATPSTADLVVASHPDYIFWTSQNGRQVLRTSKQSLQTDVLDQQDGPYAPLGLAVDETSVYWSDNRISGAIRFSAVTGEGGAQALAIGQDFPLFLAAGADSVYWSNAGGLVLRATKTDGLLTQVASSQGDGPAGALALDGGRLVFADQGGGRVLSVAGDSGDLSVVSDGEGAPLGVGVDADHVYWANSGSGEIRRRAAAGGEAELVADQQISASFVAVGASHIYWTNNGDGRVMRARKATLDVETLAQGQERPYGIALDGDALYWINQGGASRLMRLYPCACQ